MKQLEQLYKFCFCCHQQKNDMLLHDSNKKKQFCILVNDGAKGL